MTEPNIQRITFDQIDEFKALDTEKLARIADTQYIITYDPLIGKFVFSELYGGLNITNIDATTDVDIVNNNPALGLIDKLVIPEDTSLTEFVHMLLNPSKKGTLTCSVSPELVETGVSTIFTISYNYSQHSDGPMASVTYIADGNNIGANIFSYTFTSEESLAVGVSLKSSAGSLPADTFNCFTEIKGVYPEYYGSGGLASDFVTRPTVTQTVLSTALNIIDARREFVIDYPSLGFEAANWPWFAIAVSRGLPKKWAGLVGNTGEAEDPLNFGTVVDSFDLMPGTVLDKHGVAYNIFQIKNVTQFARIKITF